MGLEERGSPAGGEFRMLRNRKLLQSFIKSVNILTNNKSCDILNSI